MNVTQLRKHKTGIVFIKIKKIAHILLHFRLHITNVNRLSQQTSLKIQRACMHLECKLFLASFKTVIYVN